MTSADYVAIAVSPALIMALVGSLVYFLIEVLYVGQYQARLNYVFALFVFAAVLVARISIEMGSDRAALFALPLGVATFLVLWRFAEHPSPFSPLINLLLIGVVWWCAHKLTWDCTLIDDDEDASGEGLLQRIGVDTEEDGDHPVAGSGSTGNELIDDDQRETLPWWHRWTAPRKEPHSPGLWVLYFSLAALPLFGVGQWWIPPGDVGRRRYAFSLLAVYVASALSLLVTTSFLGLRRYLRQRRVEMPAPMAVTWVAIGAVLIVMVMLLAALVPRPHAEYAISQVPWQVTSPDGLRASRQGFGRQPADEQHEPGQRLTQDREAPPGAESDDGQHQETVPSHDGQRTDGQSSDSSQRSSNPARRGEESATSREERSDQSPADNRNDQAEGQRAEGERPTGEQADGQSAGRDEQRSDQRTAEASSTARERSRQSRAGDEQRAEDTSTDNGRSRMRMPDHEPTFDPVQTLKSLPNSLGGLSGLAKLLFYLLAGLALLYLAWRHRQGLLAALLDIVRALRELFARLWGGGSMRPAVTDSDLSSAGPPKQTFRDFRDPFLSGQFEHISPAELVCYTFEAFEAWAGDRGHPRTPDETPQELLRKAIDPHSPLYPEARRLVRLYSELAYASGSVGRAPALELRTLWRLMRNEESLTAPAG